MVFGWAVNLLALSAVWPGSAGACLIFIEEAITEISSERVVSPIGPCRDYRVALIGANDQWPRAARTFLAGLRPCVAARRQDQSGQRPRSARPVLSTTPPYNTIRPKEDGARKVRLTAISSGRKRSGRSAIFTNRSGPTPLPQPPSANLLIVMEPTASMTMSQPLSANLLIVIRPTGSIAM